MDENHSQKAIGELDVEKAFEFVKFYEDAGSTVKGRTWTITTRILTMNAALIAFCFELYRSDSDIFGFCTFSLQYVRSALRSVRSCYS